MKTPQGARVWATDHGFGRMVVEMRMSFSR